MPFRRGIMPNRQTLQYLSKGDIILRNQVKAVCFACNIFDESHKPAKEFIFWHWEQIQYKNPTVQLMKYSIRAPTPYFQAFLESGEDILIDVDGYTRSQIHERLKTVLGKTELILHREKGEQADVKNPAFFGPNSERHCICEVQGQQPCSGILAAPKYMTGRWRWNKNTIA